MSLTLEINSELEPLLKAEAEKSGSTPTAVAHGLLQKYLAPGKASHGEDETALLERINEGATSDQMERYLLLRHPLRHVLLKAGERFQIRIHHVAAVIETKGEVVTQLRGDR